MRLLRAAVMAVLLTAASAAAVLGAPAARPSPAPSAASPAEKPPSAVPIKTLLDYQKQIGFSDQQAAKIRASVRALEQTWPVLQKKHSRASTQLQALIDAKAPLDKIKAKLLELFSIKADLIMADLATSRAITGALTPQQTAKWRQIQERNAKR